MFRHVTRKKKKKEKKGKKSFDDETPGYPSNWLSSIPYNSLNYSPLFVVAESGTREASTPSKAGGGDKRKRGEKFGAAG